MANDLHALLGHPIKKRNLLKDARHYPQDLGSVDRELRVAEFFAGIGLARLGLEAAGASVVWANDNDHSKAQMYRANFGEEADSFALKDVWSVTESEIPDIDLAWASFPCTDLSVAGNRTGLGGKHSSTFWALEQILRDLGAANRGPSVVVLENVIGFASSHQGADITTTIKALNDLNYSVDVLTLDARMWVPQSRPRLFLVGVKEWNHPSDSEPSMLRPSWLSHIFDDPALRTHRAALPQPDVSKLNGLTSLLVDLGVDEDWWDGQRVMAFEESLSKVQRARLDDLRRGPSVLFRTAYRRTRGGIPRWEVRNDDLAGCLRTARGGSSRQAVVRVGKEELNIRWMAAKEYAALMGAPKFQLHGIRASQAHFGFGDAVCVPAVQWLAENYLRDAVAEGKAALVGAA